MSLPQVVIVGRPNVGKSSLFNWLAEKRLAIVDPTAGVTRDRMTFLLHERDRFFEIVDTGGMGIEDVDDLTEHIEDQIRVAIESAALVLFVVDTRDGLAPLDFEVARRLRRQDAPVLLVANKADDRVHEPQAAEFAQLGFGDPLPVSTLQNRNREALLDAILERLPPPSDETAPEAEMKVAVVGRRNVGKSTFINSVAQSERVIVSEVPGTTRDSIDVRFELDDKSFVAIDTPGLRRRKSVRTDVDFYSLHRAQRSVRRADVVLLFFDAMEPIGRVDKQLADYIAEQFKPCIFVVNKWDLVAPRKIPTGEWAQYLRDTFRTMHYVPIAFITGQTGKNLKTLLNHAQMLFKQARHRVGTGDLNRVVREALLTNPPPMHRQGRPKIYYATQVDVEPPTIVLFCNQPLAFSKPYRRYLLGALRDRLVFGEVPIKLYLRRKTDRRGTGRELPDLAEREFSEQEFADAEFSASGEDEEPLDELESDADVQETQ